MARKLTRQEKRNEPISDLEWYEWLFWGDEFHNPANCSSCYAWCESCIWSWVHDQQPRKPCDNGFAGYVFGQYRVQSCDNWVCEHSEAWVNTVM